MKKKDEKKEVQEQDKTEELEQMLKRTLADYQNLEKRVAEEKSIWIKSANRQLLMRLLPALDGLMLAEKHTKDEGVILSIKQFLNILGTEGVKKIETLGKDFNPETMECVHTAEVDPSKVSEQGEGTVLEELRSGYMLYDKVLRPAQVIVAKSATS